MVCGIVTSLPTPSLSVHLTLQAGCQEMVVIMVVLTSYSDPFTYDFHFLADCEIRGGAYFCYGRNPIKVPYIEVFKLLLKL